jgi:predicted enzyme related to lactoylglutathione lyase
MQTNPVNWFEIYVEDMERAKAFYEAVLDGKLEHLPSPESEQCELWAFPMSHEGYGAAGALIKMEGCAPGGGGTLIYFKCDDCAVEAARAAENGGRIFKEKMSIDKDGFIALVFDTEGNMIGLHSMK